MEIKLRRALSALTMSGLWLAVGSVMASPAMAGPAAEASVTPALCHASPAPANTQWMLGNGSHSLDGWSHIAPDKAGLEGLQQPAAAYALDLQPHREPGCENLPIVTAVLVKKYHDWDQQHLSGIEGSFPDGAVPLDAIDKLSLLLRINSDKTAVPSRAEYQAAYADYLNEQQLDELDNQQVTLELTLFDANHADQSVASLNGAYYLTLNPETVADQWLKVEIPLEAFSFYWEKDWQDTPADYHKHLEHRMVGLRINPETRSGNVVRNYLLDAYSEDVPALFKEIDLSLGQIALELD